MYIDINHQNTKNCYHKWWQCHTMVQWRQQKHIGKQCMNRWEIPLEKGGFRTPTTTWLLKIQQNAKKAVQMQTDSKDTNSTSAKSYWPDLLPVVNFVKFHLPLFNFNLASFEHREMLTFFKWYMHLLWMK